MNNMIRENWTVTTFGNRFEARCDGAICANFATQAEAQAHVDRAIRFNVERADKLALVNHLFNEENWKLATKREIVSDVRKACAIRDALSFFCGGAEIRCLSGGRYSVGSAGYYHYVGA
jgi:hypothetical protein